MAAKSSGEVIPPGAPGGGLRFSRVHFVGIGGIGMSGIARVLLNLGCRVTGSDLKRTEITSHLEDSGAGIFEGHRASNIGDAEAVVISSAVSASNPELKEARKRKVPVLKRAEMLAELARLKKTVTVAGCHGKTTTTSMVALALARAGADPTMIIGGRLKNISSNAHLGLGPYLVAEADESDGSFLLLSPWVAVVTNIDNDHLDFYGNMLNIRAAFLRHLQSLPEEGAAVLCADDPELVRLMPKVGRTTITYGLESKADWQARDLVLSPTGSKFIVYHRGKKAGEGELSIPGRHNVLNALAALAVGEFLGFEMKGLLAGLKEFTGVGRRLDKLGEEGGVTILDDYGHHPTEIRTTLASVREIYGEASKDHPQGRRLVAVFQPHRFSRTQLLQKEFGAAFKDADYVYVPEIYPAGESPIPGVTSQLILDSLKRHKVPCAPMPPVGDLARELRNGDVLLTIGAGDVWKIGEDLRRRLQALG